jgi:hypothetical protein
MDGAKEHFSYNAREFLQLLRAECDEVARHEAQAGAGVKRS